MIFSNHTTFQQYFLKSSLANPNWRQRRDCAPPSNLPSSQPAKPKTTHFNIKHHSNARFAIATLVNIGSINFEPPRGAKTLIFQSANTRTNVRHDSPGGAKRECVQSKDHKPFIQPTIRTLFNMFDYRRVASMKPSFYFFSCVRRCGNSSICWIASTITLRGDSNKIWTTFSHCETIFGSVVVLHLISAVALFTEGFRNNFFYAYPLYGFTSLESYSMKKMSRVEVIQGSWEYIIFVRFSLDFTNLNIKAGIATKTKN